MNKIKIIIYFLLIGFTKSLSSQNIDLELFRKIGLEESQVMEIASWICDVNGPRLTGSKALDDAQNWAVDYIKALGLENVNKEVWGEFGRGWQLDHFEMHSYTPRYWPILAYPKAWSPSTDGLVKGEVIYLMAEKEDDLLAYKGKLAGKIVLLDTIRDLKEWFDPLAKRYDEEELQKLEDASVPTPRPRRDWQRTGGLNFNQQLWAFLHDEKPLCVVDRGYKGDLGTVFVAGARVGGQQGKRPQDLDAEVIPQVTMSVEHYNRLLRLLNKGIVPTISFRIDARYELPHGGREHNVLADIPGTDKADEYVMFGAHFDSWHAGTGATDNGAGSAVMIEVARIIKEYMKRTGEKPRRTLRLALWSGEEQGLYGSVNYVRNHIAETEKGGWIPKSLKPMQSKISAYYNLDNGTGKIRGIYTQGNELIVPIFKDWFLNFKDLGVSTVTLSNTGGTDHLPFDASGIPAFQFIQEPMAYFNRTHHSNMDNWDHLVSDDLKQAATVIAATVWMTAQREDMMPRKELKLTEEETAKSE